MTTWKTINVSIARARRVNKRVCEMTYTLPFVVSLIPSEALAEAADGFTPIASIFRQPFQLRVSQPG
jgi:hypothetical protein